MEQIKGAVYALMLVSVSVGMIGLIVPSGEMKRGVKVLCGLVLSIALLSPLAPILKGLSDLTDPLPEGSESSRAEDIYAMAVDQHRLLLESRLSRWIESEWSVNKADVQLEVDGKNPESVLILSAMVLIDREVDAVSRENIREELQKMLECEVNLIERSSDQTQE